MGETVTRRGLFGHLAGAGFATVLVTSCTGQAEASELDRLIGAHRAAADAWVDAVDKAEVAMSERRFDYFDLLTKRIEAEEHEVAALSTLLSYRVANMEELRTLLGYLRGPNGPWEAASIVPDGGECEALFASIMGEAT